MFNWTEVHLYRIDFLQNPYFSLPHKKCQKIPKNANVICESSLMEFLTRMQNQLDIISEMNGPSNSQNLFPMDKGSLHKLHLHFLAFDQVRTPLVCTFM